MVNEAPWITTRFHTHLMAAAAGAWGVALAASSAIAAQHDSLIALGSGWATTAGSSTPIPMGAPSLRPFADRFADLVADKTAVAHSVLALARR
jgi:hypothetical protein